MECECECEERDFVHKLGHIRFVAAASAEDSAKDCAVAPVFETEPIGP
jgi:hypothetical protein